jgi:hypothetical protein
MSSPSPTPSPTGGWQPRVTLQSLGSTCLGAGLGFVVLMSLYLVLRSRRTEWARKVYAPRLFSARIPPRELPRSAWGWLRHLLGQRASRRVLDEVGMDAFMVNRLLVFCTKAFLCLLPFSLCVLLPLYISAAEESHVTGFDRWTITSLMSGRGRQSQLWIAVGMTYWNSAVVLYLLHEEYKWYIFHRHEFLRAHGPQSYTVLVERIPKQLCNRPALLHYFRKIFGNRVLAADVVDNNPVLNYAVKKRTQAAGRLERARHDLACSGQRPWRLYLPWACWQMPQRKPDPLGVWDQPGTAEDRPQRVRTASGGSATPAGEAAALDQGSAFSEAAADAVLYEGLLPENDNQGDDGGGDGDGDDEDDDDEDDDVTDEEDRGASSSAPATETAALVAGPLSPSLVIPGERSLRAPSAGNEEQAFLEQWQRNMGNPEGASPVPLPHGQSAAVSGTTPRASPQAQAQALAGGAARRRRRRSLCLWLLHKLGIAFYVDSIKSYERELKVWNRRVRKLQRKAARRRAREESEAKTNVVEPSRLVIQEQLRVRARQERRSQRAAPVPASPRQVSGASGRPPLPGGSGGSVSLHQRRGASGSTRLSISDSGSAASSVMGGDATLRRQQQEQLKQLAALWSPAPKVDRVPHVQQQQSLSRHDHSSFAEESGGTKARPISLPWDDGRSFLFQSLLTGEHGHGQQQEPALHGAHPRHGSTRSWAGYRSTSGSLVSETGSSLGDDGSLYDGEDEWALDDEDADAGLLEHAGFDDLLRYAVDQNERSSAFVTMSTLTAAMCAAQSVVDRPLKMSISIAPDPRDVLWENLGLSLPVLAFFTWVIRALLTALVLVFGTITAALAGLTNLAALTKIFPRLQDWLNAHGEWAFLFQQLTPMVMVIVYNLVPPIINLLLRLQRRRSVSEMQVEFFRIYFHFLVIQVFLFYTITGGVLTNARQIVDHPMQLLTLLGKALPNNELFFLQYFVTRVFLLSLDLLRLTDLVFALLRGIFRSSRTARERRSPCCGWHTVDHPNGGNIERTVSMAALNFAVALSYSVICPVVPLAGFVYFSLAMVVYRNQLLYVYTHERESAGQLFPYVFRALITGVLIFQLIMMGIFLVNASPSSTTLLLPLVFVTLTFLLFCENAYENSSRFLPLADAAELDIVNGANRSRYEAAFRHPSTLAPAQLLPEPITEDSYRQLRRLSFDAAGNPTAGTGYDF